MDAQELLASVNTLNTRSPEESFAIIERAVEGAYADLLVLRRTSSADENLVEGSVEALEHARGLLASRSLGIQHPDELERFRNSCAVYVKQLGLMERAGAVNARLAGETLSNRRRVVMILTDFYENGAGGESGGGSSESAASGAGLGAK